MKRRKHTPDQIVRKLREADRLLAEGKQVPEVVAQAVRRAQGRRRQAPQGAQNENTRLKRIVADKELEIDALREVAKGNF